MIEHIVAVDSKNGIASTDGIPWDLPEDLEFFREFIKNKRLLTGRVTYEQIGRLVGKYMYVLTSQDSLSPKLEHGRGEIVRNLNAFMAENGHQPLVIIGGQEVYSQTLAQADKLHITRIEGDFNCNRFYPEDLEDFRLVEASADKIHNQIKYRFETYERV